MWFDLSLTARCADCPFLIRSRDLLMTEPESPDSLPEDTTRVSTPRGGRDRRGTRARALDARARHRVERLLRPLRGPRRAPAGVRRLGQQDHAFVDLDRSCRPAGSSRSRATPLVTDLFSYTEEGPALGQHPLALRVEPCAALPGGLGPGPSRPDRPGRLGGPGRAVRGGRAGGAQCPGPGRDRLGRPGHSPPGAGALVVGRLRDGGAGRGPPSGRLAAMAGSRSPARVGPETWGQLLLALELLLLHRTLNLGRRGAVVRAGAAVPALGQPRRFLPDRPDCPGGRGGRSSQDDARGYRVPLLAGRPGRLDRVRGGLPGEPVVLSDLSRLAGADRPSVPSLGERTDLRPAFLLQQGALGGRIGEGSLGLPDRLLSFDRGAGPRIVLS